MGTTAEANITGGATGEIGGYLGNARGRVKAPQPYPFSPSPYTEPSLQPESSAQIQCTNYAFTGTRANVSIQNGFGFLLDDQICRPAASSRESLPFSDSGEYLPRR